MRGRKFFDQVAGPSTYQEKGWTRADTNPKAPMAAASLDSEASFKERAQKIGVTPEVLQELAEAGYTTFGRLCFAVTANPTQLEDSAVDSWIRSIFKEAPSPYQTSCLRRLLFEANSLNIADLHARVEPPAENVVRRLPAAERAARAQAQQARLAGVVFTPDTTPANSLVDLFVDQLESDILQYIGPERLCVPLARDDVCQKGQNPQRRSRGKEFVSQPSLTSSGVKLPQMPS